MEADDLMALLDNLPSVKKDLSYATSENMKWITKSMEAVLDRKLDDDEAKRLKLHSFTLAVHQVSESYLSGESKLTEGEIKWRNDLNKLHN